MKAISLLFVICSLLFTACINSTGDDSGEYGSVTINLGVSAERGVWPTQSDPAFWQA
jgi:hypothetical protein